MDDDDVSLPNSGNLSEFADIGLGLPGNVLQVDSVADRRDAASSSSGHADISDVDGAVRAAWNSLSHSVVKPVWETGFWTTIFGNDSIGDQLKLKFDRPLGPPPLLPDVTESVEANKRQRILEHFDLDIPFSRSCVKLVEDVTWQESREAQLQKALKHWAVIVEAWDPRIPFVETLLGCDSINAQLILLGDVFRNKAPSTLLKRANSIKRLCVFLGELGLYFPCSETLLYTFVCDLRDNGFPASRAKGVLEAIAFIRHTMGIDECEVMLRGRRCWGAATSDSIKEKSQASPLLVKELELLHSVLEHDTDLWNRAFSGMVLFVTYSRARWTDAQQASSLLFDCDETGSAAYVEASTGVHKTVHALQHKHQFLPLVAPAVGVCENNWADIWKDVRKQLGLAIGPNCPLFPAPNEDGTPGKRFLTSQECGKWLRALISRQLGIDESRKISSHSMKCTTLSMLAKRGVGMEDRLILGYHSSPFKIGLTYSRDAMSRPLMILEKLFEEIRQGVFKPDVTRSGRFTKVSETKIEITSDEESGWRLVEEVDQKKQSVCDRVDDSILPQVVPTVDAVDFVDVCADSSASDEESDDADTFQEAGKKVFNIPKAPDGFHLWQHTKSKILHLMSDGHRVMFHCGRKAGQFHTCNNVNPKWDTGICWRCFKGH